MRPYRQSSPSLSILSVWWSVEKLHEEGGEDSNHSQSQHQKASGQFAFLLSSVVHGELHLLLEEAFGLFGNLEDGNLEAEEMGREGAAKAKDMQKRRSLRAIRMIWVDLLLVDKLLLMLIGMGGPDEERGGASASASATATEEQAGVWSELAGELHEKIHRNLNGIVGEMVAFCKEVSLLKKSLGVVPQMLGNIVCRVTRSLTALANEDQSYFSALLSHLDLILDSSRIPVENIAQIVSSPSMDEATVSETAAILRGKAVFKKYLIVPGSHSVYRDTSYSVLLEATPATATGSSSNTPVSKASTPVGHIFGAASATAHTSRSGLNRDRDRDRDEAGPSGHFNLAFRRVRDALDPDVNWNVGQGDALQHVMPSLLTLSGTFLAEIEGEFDQWQQQGKGQGKGQEPGQPGGDDRGLRFGNLLLTQLVASQGFCIRLLSCVLVSCAYIITQPLTEESSGGSEGAVRGSENRTELGPGAEQAGGAGPAGAAIGDLEGKTDSDAAAVEGFRRAKDVLEFTRLCSSARVAAEQLNVLLEFSMGSEHGPQDQKLLEAAKPDLLRERESQGSSSSAAAGAGAGAGAAGVAGKDAGFAGMHLKGRLDPLSSSTVCSMAPLVWTNLFRNLRLITASLRAKVKPVAFNGDKAGSVSSLLFSLDELDSTVACLQPLLSL
jgi:hypothetical protein